MLLRIIPPSPSSPVLAWCLIFPPPPPTAPLPPAWLAQLQRLHLDGLAPPMHPLALDLAAAPALLLATAVFDLREGRVGAVWADGMREEWVVEGDGVLRALEGVLKDVERSAAMRDEDERMMGQSDETGGQEGELPPPVSAKAGKHRKQRSLLMSLVASLVPSGASLPTMPKLKNVVRLASPGGSPASSRPASPSPSPSFSSYSRSSLSLPAHLPSASRPLTPALLDARAFSALLDVFARFLAPRLRARLVPGGYTAWAASSALRRAAADTAVLAGKMGVADEAMLGAVRRGALEGCVPEVEELGILEPRAMRDVRIMRASVRSSVDDEGDGSDSLSSGSGSLETESDGSSVHTPTDAGAHLQSHVTLSCDPLAPAAPAHYTAYPAPSPSPSDLASYTALSGTCAHLHLLLARAHAAHAAVAADSARVLSALEVRARRRAWSAAQYVGGARVRDSVVFGLARPRWGSPLRRVAWTAGDAEGARWGQGGRVMLFPVREEEEVEGGEGEDDVLRDLEAGMANLQIGSGERGSCAPPLCAPSPSSTVRLIPSLPARPRTRSMYRAPTPALTPAPVYTPECELVMDTSGGGDGAMAPDSGYSTEVRLVSPVPAPAAPPLSQLKPLPALPAFAQLAHPQDALSMECDLGDLALVDLAAAPGLEIELDLEVGVDAEFTLAMDLPAERKGRWCAAELDVEDRWACEYSMDCR